ncbi:MAG: PTS transporter subunit EIIA [Proteobacteria bacterium]|nr:PTS transporter subunit EIIA [Pseudomonadota bacterium]
MDIDTFLSPELVVLGLAAASKAALLRELARRIAPAAGVAAPVIAAALVAREQLGSTGLGRGFALPHARIAGVPRCTGLFARLAAPVAFEAIDSAPVDLVFLLLTPGEASGGHLAALATISRRMRDEAVAAGLRAATVPEEAYRLLAKARPSG